MNNKVLISSFFKVSWPFLKKGFCAYQSLSPSSQACPFPKIHSLVSLSRIPGVKGIYSAMGGDLEKEHLVAPCKQEFC